MKKLLDFCNKKSRSLLIPWYRKKNLHNISCNIKLNILNESDAKINLKML